MCMSLHAQSTFILCYLSSQLGQSSAPPCEGGATPPLNFPDRTEVIGCPHPHMFMCLSHMIKRQRKTGKILKGATAGQCWRMLSAHKHFKVQLSPIGNDFSSLDQSVVYCTRTQRLHTVQPLDLISDRLKYQFSSCRNLIFRKAGTYYKMQLKTKLWFVNWLEPLFFWLLLSSVSLLFSDHVGRRINTSQFFCNFCRNWSPGTFPEVKAPSRELWYAFPYQGQSPRMIKQISPLTYIIICTTEPSNAFLTCEIWYLNSQQWSTLQTCRVAPETTTSDWGLFLGVEPQPWN